MLHLVGRLGEEAVEAVAQEVASERRLMAVEQEQGVGNVHLKLLAVHLDGWPKGDSDWGLYTPLELLHQLTANDMLAERVLDRSSPRSLHTYNLWRWQGSMKKVQGRTVRKPRP